MPALPMAVVVAGVLLGLSAAGLLSAYRSLPPGWDGLTAALLMLGAFLVLILVGAAGVGRTIAPGASQEADRAGYEPAQLGGHLGPGLSCAP